MKLLPPPGPKRRQQLLLLLVAVMVAAYLGWTRFRPEPAAGVAPASNSLGPAAATRPSGPVVLPEAVRLASLEPVPDQPAAGRNPFRFGVPPPRPAPPPPPPPEPTPFVAPPPPGPPPLPPISLKLGALWTMEDGRRMATLTDGKGGVFRGFEGDIIDGRYKLIKVAMTSVIVAYLDGTGQRTLSM